MKESSRRWVWPAASLALVVCVVLALPTEVPMEDDFVTAESSKVPVALNAQGDELRQQFISRGKGIKSIGMLALKPATATPGKVTLTLFKQDGSSLKSLRSLTLNASRARAGRWMLFEFKSPARVERGDSLQFVLSSKGSKSSVEWGVNPDFLAPGLAFQHKDVPQRGNLYFSVDYLGQVGKLGSLLPRVSKRALIFLTIPERVLLLITICLGAAGFAYLLAPTYEHPKRCDE